jgi:RNA polymerase sigma-B factor
MLSNAEWRGLERQHGKLVHQVAHHFKGKCQEDYEDLYQLGCLGLMKAWERFDNSLGLAFSSFAMPYIRGEIQHHLRSHWQQIKIPRQILELKAKVKRIQKKLSELGRSTTALQVAIGLGIKESDWREWEGINGPLNCSLDKLLELGYEPIQDDQEDVAANIDLMLRYLCELKGRYRITLIERYFNNLSVEAIAKKHGTSPQVVEAQIKMGLTKLKIYMKKEAV